MDIHSKLNRMIEEKGWSINRLANEAGLTQSTLSSVFIRQTIPSIPTLQKVCAALGVTLSEFFAEEPTELPSDIRRMMDIAKTLSPRQREKILELMEVINED